MTYLKTTLWGGILAATLVAGAATAQTVALAADKQGTTFNTIGAGIAKVGTDNSKLNIILRPYDGPATWAPILNSGEVAFGVMSSSSAYQAFTGKNEAKQAYSDLRVVRAGGGSLMLGFVARRDGPVKSYADLAGARVSSDYGGHLSINSSLRASLAAAGLTWNDVTAVPVTGANDGIDALVADRLDVSWASAGQPRAREADTQIGIRYLSIPEGEGLEEMYQKEVFPGARFAIAPAGLVPGIEEDTRLLSYDSYIVASVHTPDEQVRAMLEALWGAEEQLAAIHPSMRGYTQDNAVTSAPVMPYHPAAIAFYRDQGLWNEGSDARQAKLLAAK